MTKFISKPWWIGELKSLYAYNDNNVKMLNQQMNHLRHSIEDMKIEWRNITTRINSIYAENIELSIQRDEALETIESLKRQLNIRTKMIQELREFLDQETALKDKWDKRHAEMCEEISNRKKKAKITGR